MTWRWWRGRGPRASRVRLAVSPRRVTRVLLLAVVALTLASAAGQVSKYVFDHGRLAGLVPLFSVGEERNVPTWFSSATCLLAAAGLATIAAGARRAENRWAVHWIGLAVLLLALSIDETAELHERAVRALTRSGAAWPLAAGGFGAGLALVYRRFLGALPARTRRDFVLAALSLAAALGLELVASQVAHALAFGPATPRARETPLFALLTSVEELLEMLGVVALIRGCLHHLAAEGEVQVTIGDGGTRVARPRTLG